MEAKAVTRADSSQASWKKSSYSGASGGNCVEVSGDLRGFVAVRDSKNPSVVLSFSGEAWVGFLDRIRLGVYLG